MDNPTYDDLALDPRKVAIEHATPDNVAVVAALLHVGDLLSGVVGLLETLDVTVSNGLIALAEDE